MPTLVAAMDEWTTSLPLKSARSVVFWPRRSMRESPSDSTLMALSRLGDGDRLCALATAVACVLHRYGADVATLGLHGGGDELPRALAIAIDPSEPIDAVLETIKEAWRGGTLPRVPSAQPETAYNPFFPILLTLDSDVDALPELRQDMNLAIDSTEGTLRCAYGSRLFDPDAVDAFLGHVVKYLQALFASPCRAVVVGSVRYLAETEIARIEAAGRSECELLDPSDTVQALFSSVAARCPDAAAVEAAGLSWTYRDLDRLSGRVAAGLLASSVMPHDSVALSIRPGIKQIAGLIGILKIGAVPVPIDYTFPKSRVDTILEIAAPKTLLTDGALSRGNVEAVPFLGFDELVTQQPEPIAGAAGGLDDLIYVLFTSGSTGTPKGVAMGQRTLVNLVKWQQTASGAYGQRTLNRSSLGFDVGFQEIFATLCFGQTLVVASEAERSDIVGLASLIEQRLVERIFLPPVSLVQMAEAFDDRTPLAKLRHVIVAGEALRITPAIIRMFRSCGARVTNQYGPTETHVATSWDLQGSSLRWPQLPPIGRPIANARVHVLDAGGQLCPIGVKGQIAIGGLLPARGYLARPNETGERFVPDPFADDSSADGIMYLTGDFGRLAADGTFEFLGRRDDQVKLRGYRIELGDIEFNATGIAGVKMAAAVVRKREQSGDYIALFVEPKTGAVLDPRHLRESLAAKLPEHMVPSLGAIVILQELPLNRNGKVDRARLPEIAEHRAGPDEDGALDAQIEAIWRRYLNLAEIRCEDDFIALGGHSLLAIQIVSSVNDRFGITVPVVNLLHGASFGRFVDTVGRLINMKSKSGAAPQALPGRQALYQVRLADGRNVMTPYPEEARHYHREIFERGVYLRHGVSLDGADTIIDVGANIGLFSLAVLERRPGCRLIAIEPAPLPAAALKHNLAVANGNVTVFEIGLSDREGEREFTYYPNVTGMSSFLPDAAADRALLSGLIANARSANADVDRALAGNEADHLEARLVSERLLRPVERLSTTIHRLSIDRIDLLKIDVQRGSEAVLAGISEADWLKVRQVVIEHQHGTDDRSAVERCLIRAGFHVTTEQDDIHRGTNVVYTYARRAT